MHMIYLATIIHHLGHCAKKGGMTVQTAIFVFGIEGRVHSFEMDQNIDGLIICDRLTQISAIDEPFNPFRVESRAIWYVEGLSAVIAGADTTKLFRGCLKITFDPATASHGSTRISWCIRASS
jgi:hypothetical protein